MYCTPVFLESLPPQLRRLEQLHTLVSICNQLGTQKAGLGTRLQNYNVHDLAEDDTRGPYNSYLCLYNVQNLANNPLQHYTFK